MSDEVLETLVRDYMQLGFSVGGFAWQGGEPTLMGVDFFKKAVKLQQQYGSPGQQVSNTLQTNGVLLDDNWCRFFQENKFLIGISIDGPKEFHDIYRVDHSGKGTFEKVMRGIECCKRHQVEFSALVLLNNVNVEQPERLFDFLVENDLTYLQFIPCVEFDVARPSLRLRSGQAWPSLRQRSGQAFHGLEARATGQIADFSIMPKQYGDFLCKLFDLWYDYGPAKLNIREFDSLITYFVLGKHTICTYSKQCAGFVVIEHTGEAFCCEFFVEPKWRLGNILETPIEKLASHNKKRAFARDKEKLCNKCLVCRHLDICRGGCMKDRILRRKASLTGDSGCSTWHGLPARENLALSAVEGTAKPALSGAEGMAVPHRENYFCESYKQFFDYTVPRFMQIAAAIKAGSAVRHTRSAEKIRLRIEK